jgi:hypothetical protein
MNELACRVAVMALGFAFGAFEIAARQVKTTAPDIVAGARPAIVERITIRGKSIEGNLEGNAVDRTVLVVLPPGYQRERNRFTAIPLAPNSGRRRSTCRRRSRARSHGARAS